MSQIRKSASFRSRIPVRRTKPIPRRCYSPPPYAIATYSSINQSNANDCSIYDNSNSNRKSRAASEQRNHKNRRQRFVWPPPPPAINTTTDTEGKSITVANTATRPITTAYSSSSYSSSDESQESEAPQQYLLKQCASSGTGIVRPPLNISTDAMSLDGILDSISCGSISSPPSPANYLTRNDAEESYSSYDSLDKYNYALETLKLTDNNNYFNANNCMLQPKCRQPYVHNNGDNVRAADAINDQLPTPQLPPRPPLPTTPSSTAIDKDLAKQQQLSDWYYIKTGPKSPLPTCRVDNNNKRNGIYSGGDGGGGERTTNGNKTGIKSDERIYVKNTKFNPKPSRESIKNDINIYNGNGCIKRDDKCNRQFKNVTKLIEPQMLLHQKQPKKCVESDSGAEDHDDGYHAIGKTSETLTPNNQNSNNELLCKFISRNNNVDLFIDDKKINAFAQRHQHHDKQQFSSLSSSASPSSIKKHQQPPYYIEKSQKHLASPRQDRRTTNFEKRGDDFRPNKVFDEQTEQFVASKLQHYHEQRRLHSTPNDSNRPKTNSNLYNVAVFQQPSPPPPLPPNRLPLHQQPKRYGEVNSSSFEHVNLSSGFLSSSAALSSEMTIPEKQFKSTGNFVITDTEQQKQNRVATEMAMASTKAPAAATATVVGRECLQQTMQMQQPQNRRKAPPPPPPLRIPSTAPITRNQKNQKLYPPKSRSYRSECELFGSYVSLECPPPPAPPACLPDSRRDPQARLSRFLKVLYTELALKEPIIPAWANPITPGALCPARLEPEFRLHSQSHGFSDPLSVEQLLTPIQTKDGQILEAPRRLLIECPHWVGRNFLAMRILHAWSKEPPWPTRGTPVAVAIFLPLAELNHKKSISNFVEKELISKGSHNPFANGFGGFSSAWNSLAALGPKLLIVIDGYDIVRSSPKRKAKNVPQDIIDLLEGKLFPESRIIIISASQNVIDILPLVQRHVKYEGLTWGRSASLLGGGQWGAPSRLLDTIQQCVHLRHVARTPLGCLALAAIYDVCNGDLPTEEMDVVESIINCVAPDASQAHIAELGRLALFSLKTKRSAVTSTEIKMYCSNPESSILACLDRAQLFGKSVKKKNEFIYTPMCAGIIEFLAANYIASLANRPGLLAAEITGLSLNDEVEPEILKVLTFAMSLLGSRAHILLSKLTPLWLSPQTVFSLALNGGDSTANLNALCDLLGISKTPPISPLETNPIWVQIRSTPNELQGWALALKSPNCTLKNLELSYQTDKQTTLDSRNSLDVFLDALSLNESVSTLRITSLIENDAKEADINVIANCVSKALLKPRLENFELILTLLEEDPPVLKLQSVVTALCRSLPHQQKIGSMLLDLGLCTSQLGQICSVLEKCPHVTRISLPHLRCERGAVGALASLLIARPLASLALPSCWGARDDPPSSSGVSMGSGSGSSTGTSSILKQSSLAGAPSPRSYPPGLFSSLPRGALIPANSMGRSATLPRQPLDCPPDKRSSDSVVSKTWYPTPACDGGPHNSGTLHELLLAAREPFSRLHGLDLSKAQLSLEDSMCLGETVRVSTQLHSIKLEGSSRVSEVLPTVLGAGESISLQMMSLASPRLALEDGATAMASRSLANCVSLRLLSLDGWSFRVDNSSTFSAIRAFLAFTCVRELGLSNCRLHLPTIKIDAIPSIEAYECRSVVVLKMAGAQVILADHNILRGPQLLPYLSGFPCLRELDLSAPARAGLGGSTATPFILDDKRIIGFFQALHTHFSMLNTLKMCNWILHLDDASKTIKAVSKALRNSPLSHVKTDGISVMDRPKKTRIEPTFLHLLLSSLNSLRWLGISLAGKKDEQITAIGNAVLDIRGSEIDIRLSESTIEGARLMAQAISLDSKFDVRVSTFGTSSGILVHAEKMGTKSLSRKY